ncbi:MULTISPECIES: DUF2165 family protein [unclassified Burkholderia]|uniref:DUF2165 family protein n=1 Tax=unclassified Burkholderia TaxID=2613784 RepID=UPI0014222B84|nr:MULTISPECIES: DUF2165 family protein [unclassified Burkholderia]NIE57335.1 DUF2165 domain-containing protein [Burkholderia sp. Ap-955]NIF08061.1 DUF2165 domain-containing protein [Burkholderia sp. Ax-1735]NIG02065.1 DUF2165 domain-containing protein [Burkholderia sp. Tr-849]
MSIRIAALSRTLLLAGLATWLTIAVFNNITDSGTNRVLLGHMLSMDLLRADPQLGAGLVWRAWPLTCVTVLLDAVIAAQLTVAGALWSAAVLFAFATWRADTQRFVRARGRAIVALSGFLVLWIWFACGGLWFGYWIKQGAVQSVHMTLILIAMSALLYVQGLPFADSANAA